MSLTPKALWIITVVIATFWMSSCSSTPEPTQISETAAATTPSKQLIHTSMMDFEITSARLVDVVHERQSQPGEKFLLVTLAQPGSGNLVPGKFSLETFQKMIQDNSGKIYVSVKDGTQITSNMAGWVEDEFVVGFTVPFADTYILYWSENSPIELDVKR